MVPYTLQIASYMTDGEPVPDQIVSDLVQGSVTKFRYHCTAGNRPTRTRHSHSHSHSHNHTNLHCLLEMGPIGTNWMGPGVGGWAGGAAGGLVLLDGFPLTANQADLLVPKPTSPSCLLILLALLSWPSSSSCMRSTTARSMVAVHARPTLFHLQTPEPPPNAKEAVC